MRRLLALTLVLASSTGFARKDVAPKANPDDSSLRAPGDSLQEVTESSGSRFGIPRQNTDGSEIYDGSSGNGMKFRDSPLEIEAQEAPLIHARPPGISARAFQSTGGPHVWSPTPRFVWTSNRDVTPSVGPKGQG
jgi:hypothetical protein